MCDEIGILNRGRLISRGLLSELLSPKSITYRVEDLDDGTIKRLEPLASTITREHHHWAIQLADPGHREEAYAILSQGRNLPIEVQANMESLEDFFFRKIAEDDQKRGFSVSARNSVESADSASSNSGSPPAKTGETLSTKDL